ncbi:winged helix-turn-helix domain-containing protein [Vibrio alginolyticus]|uniref:winged helix-turn-helix domain-containing protein n=1 Tax=Vibrio alginolyticus TaxID=663 RepID=UPI0025563CB0|nr:helix-turn-helix domain-containing protein [Vibrio alginolyticus]MDL0445805.1 helix-turn-helix domain-containing protein [Vibrio alginolyticus]
MKKYINKETNLLTDENELVIKKLSEAESNLLLEFMSHKGKCLSRTHLIGVAWPDTFVVENSLNMAIRKLRGVGINIETVPRKGYALVDDNIRLESERKSKPHTSDDNLTSFLDSTHSSFVRTQGAIPVENKSTSFWGKFQLAALIIYFLLLIVINFILEGAKPDISCYKNKDVEVCTTYEGFNINDDEVTKLSPGVYIYGKKYDDGANYQFIPVKE